MHNTKQSREDFLFAIENIQAQFEKTVQFLEQQDFDSSSDLMKKISNDMSGLIEKLAKDYPHALHAYKFSKLETIESTLSDFQSDKKRPAEITQYTDILVQLNKYIHTLEAEIKKNYPVQPAWLTYVSVHRKKILLSLLGLILLSIPVAILRHFYAQRHGLRGHYFSRADLSKLHRQRVDGMVNFYWGMGSPFPKWKKDGFSVRWSGFLRVPEDGEYEFFTHSDDGVRLFLGDMEVISNWTNHNTTVNKVRLLLKKAYYPIKLEYYENKRKSVIRLLWKPDGDLRAVPIPAKYLVPSQELLKSDIPVIGKLEGSPSGTTEPDSESGSEVGADSVE